ncbi:MAG: sigma factor [Solirubrobacteraceae bacterium]
MVSNNPGTYLTDAAIIVASQRDPALFAQIFDRHWTRVHRYCVSRAGAAGEDIAAETFRVALDSRRRFDRSRVDAGPWLFGIATNLLRHRLRLQTRRTEPNDDRGATPAQEGAFLRQLPPRLRPSSARLR